MPANNPADQQNQINEALIEGKKLVDKENQAFQNQLSLVSRIAEILKGTSFENLAKNSQVFGQVTEEFAKAAKELDSVEKEIRDINKAIEEGGKQTTIFTKLLEQVKKVEPYALLSLSLHGFVDGLKVSIKFVKSLISYGGTLVKTVSHIALSIISFPFKVLKRLIESVDTGGQNQLAMALEEIRKEFGYLHKEAGGHIVQMARAMRGMLAETGMSVRRVEGMMFIWDRLKYVAEWAKNIGPLFDTMWNKLGGKNLENAIERLTAYNKALGLSAEAQKAVATRAKSSGTEINEINRQIANYSIQFADMFGVTMKRMSKDIGEMMTDFKNFGHLSVKELAQAAVYARKLGIEVKNLGGIMDKWLNFEDAAKGASELSQAFGMNINALEMMKAQNPAEKIELLRKAFFRTGRSVEQMTYQERRLLAQQSGLDDASIGLVFSLKNQALSYNDVIKKGDAAKKKQLSQAEAMEKLARAIERMVMSGGGSKLGFFDRFIAGFERGVRWSREWRRLVYSLRRALRDTYWAGVRIGRMFVGQMPVIQQFFQSLANFFERRKFRELLRGVQEAFRLFAYTLRTDPSTALPKLLTFLKERFFNFFSARSPAANRLLQSVKEMFRMFIGLINGGMKMAMKGLTTGISFIADLLSGKKKLADLAGPAMRSHSFLAQAFNDLIAGLQPLADKLFEAIKKLALVVFDKIAAWWENHGKTLLLGLLTPALVGGVAKPLAAALISGLMRGILERVISSQTTQQMRQMTERLSQLTTRQTELTETLRRNAPAGGIRAAAGADAARKGMQSVSPMATAAAGAAEAARALPESPNAFRNKMITLGVMVAAVVVLMGALFLFAKKATEYNISPATIAASAVAMAGIATVIGALSGAIYAASLIKANMAKQAATGLVIVSGAAIAIALTASAIIRPFASIRPSDIAKAIPAMAAISAFYLATSVLTLAVSAIGTFVLSTAGIGFLAISAGLYAMSDVIQQMTGAIKTIMEYLRNFNPGAGFEEKADSFAKIVKAVGSFAGVFGNILKDAAPSLLDLGNIVANIFKDRTSARITQIANFVRDIIPRIGEFVNRLLQATREIPAASLEKASVLGDIIGSVSELIKGMIPSLADFRERTSVGFGIPGLGGEGSLFSSQSSGNMLRALNDMGTFISRITFSVGNLLIIIRAFIQNFLTSVQGSNINADKIKPLLETIPPIISAVGGLVRGLILPPALIQVMRQAQNQEEIRRTFNSAVTSIREAITGDSGLLDSIRQFIERMLGFLSRFSPSQVNTLKAAAPVLKAVFETVASVASVVSSLSSVSGVSNIEERSRYIDKIREFAQSFLNMMQNQLGTIITNILNAFKAFNMDELRRIKAGVEIFSTFLQSASTLLGFTNEFSRSETVSGAQMNTVEGKLAILNRLFAPASLVSGGNQQTSLITVAHNVLSGLNTLPSVGRGTITKVTALKGFFEAISTIPGALREFTAAGTDIGALPTSVSTLVTNLEAGFRDSGINRVTAAVTGMITQMNELHNRLSNIQPINLDTGLRGLAQSLALGSEETYRIPHRDFQININLKVNIGTQELVDAIGEFSKKTTPKGHWRITGISRA